MTSVTPPDPAPVPKRPPRWWDGPVKVLRAMLRGLDRAVGKLMKLLSYGSH